MSIRNIIKHPLLNKDVVVVNNGYVYSTYGKLMDKFNIPKEYFTHGGEIMGMKGKVIGIKTHETCPEVKIAAVHLTNGFYVLIDVVGLCDATILDTTDGEKKYTYKDLIEAYQVGLRNGGFNEWFSKHNLKQ